MEEEEEDEFRLGRERDETTIFISVWWRQLETQSLRAHCLVPSCRPLEMLIILEEREGERGDNDDDVCIDGHR